MEQPARSLPLETRHPLELLPPRGSVNGGDGFRDTTRERRSSSFCDCDLALDGNGILLDRAEVSKRRPCGGLHTDGDPSYKDSEFETDSSNSVWAPLRQSVAGGRKQLRLLRHSQDAPRGGDGVGVGRVDGGGVVGELPAGAAWKKHGGRGSASCLRAAKGSLCHDRVNVA